VGEGSNRVAHRIVATVPQSGVGADTPSLRPPLRAVSHRGPAKYHSVKEFNVKSFRSGVGLCSIFFAAISMPALAQDSPEAVVKKRFEATAHRDIDAIAALYAPDAVETSPAFCVARQGSVGARKTYGDLFRDAPGIEDEVTNFVVDGNHVAVQFIARVRKPDGSIAFEVPLANFLTVDHGRIVRDDTYFDAKGRPCS
jgi:hypothetical protein